MIVQVKVDQVIPKLHPLTWYRLLRYGWYRLLRYRWYRLSDTVTLSLGRKNWLFCGNDDAAENAAIIYSMMGCCQAHQVNFRDWLVYFLNNVHSYDNDYGKDLAQLLPHNFKQQQAAN